MLLFGRKQKDWINKIKNMGSNESTENIVVLHKSLFENTLIRKKLLGEA